MSAELTPEQEKQVQERVDTIMARLLQIMKKRFGEEVYQVLVKEQREMIRSHFSKIVEESGDNSIEAFIKLIWGSFLGEYTMEETESGFQMICTKCPMDDLAKRHGITEQMFYQYCVNDEFNMEGFNPNIGFKRTKTLMQGDDCCDHFYYYKDKNK